MKNFKMVIIDDEYLVRRGIRETIQWDLYDIEIIGEANNGKKGFDLIKELKPDIVISDIKMPVMDGVELVKNIEKEKINVAIIILSGYKDFDFAKDVLESGAYEYLLKPIDNQELIQSVLKALDKYKYQQTISSKAQVFDEQKGIIENHLVFDLLTGQYQSFTNIQKRLENIQTPLPSEGYLVLINIDDQENHENNDTILSFSNHYLNRLHHLSSNYYLTHFNEDLVILINENKEKIKLFFKELIERFESKEDQSLSIGVSNQYISLAELNKAFSQAKKAVDSKMYIGFSHLLFYEDKNIDIKPIVKNVMNYIHDHYHENISVKSAAENLLVSESYLLHQFKKHSHKTFNECLTKHRILTAKKKLLNRDKRIYEVANEIGYQDAKYFSQIFKRRVGLSPTEYREAKGINE